jgi:hypothetical protein
MRSYMTSFTIVSNNSDHITINILESAQAEENDQNGYNWLPGTVSVSAGVFSGSYDFALRKEELEAFRNEVYCLF